MPRARQRACLESGQKLDINQLRRTGVIPAALNGEKAGTLGVKFPQIDFAQEIQFVSRKRHFGGRQYYFVCPVSGRLASVLWRPSGASRFACRQAWRGQVGYATQFADPCDRAHLAKRKIRRRLGDVDEFDDLPPRPKHMRHATYERWRERYNAQQQRLDDALMMVWQSKWALLKAFK